MQGQLNPKIVGATVIGFALVFGAYTVSNFTNPSEELQRATVTTAASTERVAIAVADTDNNGIEDWRDEFITTDPVILGNTDGDYTPPETVTGRLGIEFMENVIRSRGYGPFGNSDAEVVEATVDSLRTQAEDTLYDTPDITIMEEWDNQDIVNYANTLAATLIRHNVPDMENELLILHDVITNEKIERVGELQMIADVYKNYRDDTLLIPVPGFLAKEHLDLINTYNALYQDIIAMTLTLEDPAVTILRLKRYQDDAAGLAYAFENMYAAVEPYAGLFTVDDPAAVFVNFSPDYQLQN